MAKKNYSHAQDSKNYKIGISEDQQVHVYCKCQDLGHFFIYTFQTRWFLAFDASLEVHSFYVYFVCLGSGVSDL